VRTCDSCFNRSLTLEEQAKAKETIGSIRPLVSSSMHISNDDLSPPQPPTSSQVQSAAATEREKKESLFGFAFGSDQSKKAAPEPVKQTQQSQGSMSATMGLMSETHEKLQERGERLSRVADKTDELANQAGEFARLAKQLNAQQKSRWF
jgi:syntaxin-binding protein 5